MRLNPTVEKSFQFIVARLADGDWSTVSSHPARRPQTHHPFTLGEVKLELLLVGFESSESHGFKLAPLELRQSPEAAIALPNAQTKFILSKAQW